MTTNEGSGASKGGRPRSVQSQQAILDATLALLATEGFEAMSIEAIATRAGVGKKTIYRWWSSKEALVIDAIKNVQQMEHLAIDTGSVRDDLLTLFRMTFRVWSRPDARSLLLELVRLTTTRPEVFQIYNERILAPRLKAAIGIIQQAQERGEVRQDLEESEMVSFLAGPIWYHLLFSPNSTPPASLSLERLVDVMLHGIVGQREPERRGENAASRNAQEL